MKKIILVALFVGCISTQVAQADKQKQTTCSTNTFAVKNNTSKAITLKFDGSSKCRDEYTTITVAPGTTSKQIRYEEESLYTTSTECCPKGHLLVYVNGTRIKTIKLNKKDVGHTYIIS